MAKGIIYVCSTAVEGLIKIGKTTDFETRMLNLESNGYRNVAGLKRQFAIELENYDEIESLIDDLFSKSRVGNTELFSLNLNKVIQLLSALQGKQIYPREEEETKEQVFERVTEAVQSSYLPDGKYYINARRNRVRATMVISQGEIVLKKGSRISNLAASAGPGVRRLSTSLNVVNNILQEDTPFSSVSSAAAVVMGTNWNGWRVWKDENGDFIDKYRQNSASED